jgi:hypothetical protein
MKQSNIRDDHHFVKFCKHTLLIRENGTVIGVHAEAFELRKPTPQFPTPEKTVSGVYYEHYDGTDDEKICACLHFIDMDVKKKDALARMNVALIKEQGKERSRPLRVVNEPFKECLGYAALRGLPPVQDTDHALCALLAKLSIVQIVPVAVI